MTYNTFILRHGEHTLTRREYKKFSKGDTIWGENNDTEELGRWNVADKKEALKTLAKYKNRYDYNDLLAFIEEYALEFCYINKDGDFVEGGMYIDAENDTEHPYVPYSKLDQYLYEMYEGEENNED